MFANITILFSMYLLLHAIIRTAGAENLELYERIPLIGICGCVFFLGILGLIVPMKSQKARKENDNV